MRVSLQIRGLLQTRLARPARITASAAKLIFEITELLLQVSDFFFLGGDFVILLINFLTGVLLAHGFLRVGIILDIGLFSFAPQDCEFLLSIGDFPALSGKALAPGGFGVGVLIFFSSVRFGSNGCSGRRGGGDGLI